VSDIAVLVSRLAGEQLADLSPRIGRAMAQALERLAVFPESAPTVLVDGPVLSKVEGYEGYHKLVVRGYRAIYRYFPDENHVRVYCILHPRRRLPAVEFLLHQTFW